MYSKRYSDAIGDVGEIWAAKVLGMKNNPHPGIDLIDERKGVEIGVTIKNPGEYKNRSWRKLERDVRFGENGKPSFWGFALYSLPVKISELRERTTQLELERKVTRWSLFILSWGWIYQFQSYHHKGETRNSKWDHWLRFPKFKYMPPVKVSYQVEKGVVHLTEGVPIELFDGQIKGERIPIFPS